MASKQKEYDRGWASGLDFANRLVDEGGPQALKDQIKVRGIISEPIPWKAADLDRLLETIKQLASASLRVAIIAVLHDQFGFGQKRVQKFNDAYSKFLDYLDRGWISWFDITERLRKELDLNLEDSEWLHDDRYERPDAEDVYTPDDFINPIDWSQLLQDLGYSDWQDKTTPTKHYIRTGDGSQLLWTYDGQYEQVRLYDFLDGIRYAVQTWGLADEKEGETRAV